MFVRIRPFSHDLTAFRLPQCKDGRVQEDAFIAAVKDKVSKGKLVQLGVFWNFGQHANDTAQAKYIDTVTSIIDKYGFNGIDLNEFVRLRSRLRLRSHRVCTDPLHPLGVPDA